MGLVSPPLFTIQALTLRPCNRRLQRDPLGESQPCTWQTRLIKVAARVTERARRVVVELSGSWPYLEHYRRVSEQVLDFSPPGCDSS